VRLMFVYYLMGDAGSAQDVHHYTRAAKALGHEVLLYGRAAGEASYHASVDVAAADAVIFVFEWTTQLRDGDALDLLRLVSKVPRERRFVIDCDGNYNEAINVAGDYNHREAAASRRWIETCDSLSDKIYQPTLHPLRPNVRPFFFHGYDPAWEAPVDFRPKDYGMAYVGHSKFRWAPMYRVLQALEPIRTHVGRIALVGHGWDALPPWAAPMKIEDYYYTDPAYLRKLDVEIIQPIPVAEVIPWMGRAVFNPVIYRPLFEHLRLVTCRTFETPAAGTIPVFGLDAEYVREIYGDVAVELVLPDHQPTDKILDIFERPEHYAAVVAEVRRHLAEKHSYAARLRDLIGIVTS
jgi:hypothetical protein